MTRPALLALALLAPLAGCRHAMCEPRPVGAPWRRYEPLLPVNTVVCGPNRVSRKPSNGADDFPPTQLFLFFRDDPVPVAFERTLRRFEAAGWTVTDRRILAPGRDGLYTANVHQHGATIHITVNRNDWGVQGSFEILTAAPDPP